MKTTRTQVFNRFLFPGGKTTLKDNQDLARALMTFLQRTNRDDFGVINQFLSSHPQSPWRASLLTELGLSYRHAGWFSKALSCWSDAWNLAKNESDPKKQ